MVAVSWQFKRPSDLNLKELYGILALRNAVFIVELECPVKDTDGEDLNADVWHVMGYDTETGEIIAYLRLHDLENREVKIRRVVVAKEYRGAGLARELMNETINWSRARGTQLLSMGARIHLEKFYESVGFKRVSEPYFHDEVKVWHVDMAMQLTTPAAAASES